MSLEFRHPAGRTDILMTDDVGRVVAFEAKLSDWRRALHQAYRNTCFAELSYIVVPEDTARRALVFRARFQALGIGICSASPDGIVIHERPQPAEPLLPWLHERAKAAVNTIDDKPDRQVC